MKISNIVFLSRSNYAVVAETGEHFIEGQERKARKRRYSRMGSSSNSMEMPRPFFSEEAGLKSTQRTFDCIYLLLQKYAFLLLPSFVS